MRWVPGLTLAALLACQPGVEPPHLTWEADAQSLSNPFPDLRLLDGSGFHLRKDWYRPFLPAHAMTRDMKDLLASYEPGLAAVEGVGNFTPTLLPATELLDLGALQGSVSRLVLKDGAWQVLEADVSVEVSRQVVLREGKDIPADFPEFLFARPAVPLPENADGMLVVREGLKTAKGQLLGRGFAADRDADQTDRRKLAAKALGIPESKILLTLPLHGAPVSARMRAVTAWADQAAPPLLTVPAHALTPGEGSSYPDGVWRAGDADFSTLWPWLQKWAWSRPADQVAEVVYGTVLAHDLRKDGVWNEAWVSAPDQAPQVALRFVVSVPKGARPAGGWPVVVVGHGLSSRNTSLVGDQNSVCLELAQVLAAQGFACAGIDAPSHGSRGNSIDFFALDNLFKVRDTFRQMVVDQMQFIRALPTLDVDGDGVGDFQRDVGYWGNSFGSIMGANLVAVDPRVRTSVLNVPGGGLANILNSDDIRDKIGLLLVTKTNLVFQSPEYFGMFPFFRTLGQLVIDPGDPVNIGQMLPADRAVLAQESVGDFTIPNATTEDLATGMRLAAVDAPRTGTALQVMFRADPAAYLTPDKSAGLNPHELMWQVEAAPLRAQATRFLISHGTQFDPKGLEAK